jgi:predicted aminopeptidase
MAISRRVKFVIAAALLLAAAAAAGCSTIGYYWQAMHGQMEVTRKARPIAEVMAGLDSASELRARLARVVEMREFASTELALPDNGSYRRYADLERPYVVWNVFAAPEFSTLPREWCFPFAGCVGYKGYFDKAGAEALAQRMSTGGDDVYVGGVPAYSTLGWLDDPVLNTFVRYPEPEIARLIFHELAHQVVYVKGDSTFNESFAVTVEQEGVRRWLERHGTPQQYAEFERGQQRKQAFVALVDAYRTRLAELYSLALEPAQMRLRKHELLTRMRADYVALKQGWDGYSGYDRWFEQPLNNAQLASIAIYTQLVPGFQRMLRDSGGDLPRFYAEVKRVAALPQAQRDATLARLSASVAVRP